MSAGTAIMKAAVGDRLSPEAPNEAGWPILPSWSSAVTSFAQNPTIIVSCRGIEIETVNRPGFHVYSRAFETTVRQVLERFLEGVIAASVSVEKNPQLDIEEPHIFQMPVPETQWLSATVTNLGPAKPKLVLDFIPDEE